MSDATKAALQDAIAAHVADECEGDAAGAWVVVAESTNVTDMENDMSSWYIASRDYQSSIMTNRAAVQRALGEQRSGPPRRLIGGARGRVRARSRWDPR